MSVDLDWNDLQYGPIIKERMRRLQVLREKPELIGHLKRVYRDEPWRFIDDWGVTYDPRNLDISLPASVPFIMFPAQREWCKWVFARWKAREHGVTPKSRDVGVSWLFVSLMTTFCLFNDGFAAGVGSRKEEYVDKAGSPKALFWKARKFIAGVPPEFRAGHIAGVHDPHLRLIFPATGSTFTGEAGDNIGRGDRATIYGVDEAAYLMRPQLIEDSLSATTNCRIDISSANGMANPFADKVHGRYKPHQIFYLHWRDDPRKNEEWYAKQKEQLDPVTVAQEIDINFAASVTGVVIPNEWVQSAIDAHIHLGIEPTGERIAALDIADEGVDKNAFGSQKGILLDFLEEWSGEGSDTYQSVVKSFSLADSLGISSFLYDADGMGALVRGDARAINDRRREEGLKTQKPPRLITPAPFRGSGGVDRPDAKIALGADRTNGDYYGNMKAQSWGRFREKFKETHRARTEPGYKFDPTKIISICSKLPCLTRLTSELSQPTWGPNEIGKMIVDKAPDGSRSPNLADTAMMMNGAARRRMTISPEAKRRA